MCYIANGQLSVQHMCTYTYMDNHMLRSSDMGYIDTYCSGYCNCYGIDINVGVPLISQSSHNRGPFRDSQWRWLYYTLIYLTTIAGTLSFTLYYACQCAYVCHVRYSSVLCVKPLCGLTGRFNIRTHLLMSII